jgi:hypothetical protein
MEGSFCRFYSGCTPAKDSAFKPKEHRMECRKHAKPRGSFTASSERVI